MHVKLDLCIESGKVYENTPRKPTQAVHPQFCCFKANFYSATTVAFLHFLDHYEIVLKVFWKGLPFWQTSCTLDNQVFSSKLLFVVKLSLN